MKSVVPFILFAVLAGCATLQAASRNDGRAALGEATYVDGLHVTPRRVIEDSRCPINARCIWAGRVVLGVVVEGGSWRREMELTLGEPQHVADGALALVSVIPGQLAGSEIDNEDYVFAFEFDGGI
ncbi:MAG: hypothetical protein HKN78_08045 [Sphingomonadaceae bacterium]|nr:hypothetical protein [Sphingomonadaceae bacterium]